jgi:hypothetical protein
MSMRLTMMDTHFQEFLARSFPVHAANNVMPGFEPIGTKPPTILFAPPSSEISCDFRHIDLDQIQFFLLKFR